MDFKLDTNNNNNNVENATGGFESHYFNINPPQLHPWERPKQIRRSRLLLQFHLLQPLLKMSPLHRMGSKDKLKLGLGLRLRVGVPLILLLGAALAYFIAQTAWAKKRAAKSPQTGLIPGYRQPKAVKAPPPNGLSFEAPSNSMIHGTPDRLIVEASPTGPRGLMSSKKRLAELTRRYLTTHFFGGTIQRFNVRSRLEN